MGHLTATFLVGVLTRVPLILSESLVIVVTFVRIWDVALRRNDSPMVQVPRLVLKEGVLYFLLVLPVIRVLPQSDNVHTALQ